MIRFENVSIAYDRKSKPALDDVSFDVQRGEFVFLVGSSGSGKSTLLRLVLREHKTPHGHIYVAGQNVASVPSWRVPKFRRGIGVVFQDFRLIQTKTVFANVAYAMQVLGKSRAAIRVEVPRVLELVGLEDKGRRLPTELSGGEQQRVAIARAIVNQPGILLADEPTGNLDPTTSAGIMEILDKINQNGTTVVMATHDDDIVNSMRKRVIELKHGKVVRDENAAQYTSMIPVVPAAGAAKMDDAEPQTRRQRIVSAAAARDAANDSLPPRLERRRGPDPVPPADNPAGAATGTDATGNAKTTIEDHK
ncbi:cell division transport system ATP-binding protein [Arthrobacter stackebrandtii]|uniref:Cell division ATP-binding protein FtsE n=1 Tax=Arthrobacter stackebrandtii TaxID=272161 RepID=A0ABS4YYI9_9MICC|nr:cell division ATP-binding protein FtsE [Arthrobacter stackebrandtii]MBP2413789.1 cell division transport system ATP-binding protein [Arthrobacter stackebrandtii]PYH00372.1 cell division ATP-binding protein FtsE [Arthrobacter stackebrandtii]